LPVQRVSKPFKDISASFLVNPLNYDLIGLTNENAIARSIRNLILTGPGERPFSPALGSRVTQLLFDNIDALTAASIDLQIRDTINIYEPRVRLIDVIVKANAEQYAFDVQIQYTIVGVDAQAQELTFALEPTR
jgi:phage baseplate assembly protein W